jgi:hypothetical protein
VFTSPLGTALDSRNVTREFHALLAAANLPPIRFHDPRHTAATVLLAQGVDPRTIIETLGHSQISLTLIVSLEQPHCVAFGDHFSRHVEPLQSRCGWCHNPRVREGGEWRSARACVTAVNELKKPARETGLVCGAKSALLYWAPPKHFGPPTR